MQITKQEKQKAERKYFDHFNNLVPMFYGLLEEDLYEEWYIKGIEKAIKENNPDYIYENYLEKGTIA